MSDNASTANKAKALLASCGPVPERLVSLGDLSKWLNLDRSTIWRIRRSDPTFPRPIMITGRTPRFRASELTAWQETRTIAETSFNERGA